MRRFPEVFAPVHEIIDKRVTEPDARPPYYRFIMPRFESAVSEDVYMGLLAGAQRLQTLWAVNSNETIPYWRERLLTHLKQQIETHQLYVDVYTLAHVIEQLPNPISPGCCIHGDATLANLLWERPTNKWWWIDPLRRPFIPNDPHVDLGKMFQSCFEYEAVLTHVTNRPAFNHDVARRLAEKTHLSYAAGRLWLYIHLVRLLPYQVLRVRKIYEHVLARWPWWATV